MDALAALKTRRSIRKYQKREVARELLQEVVDCGRLAATARNVQPWQFVVVTDPARLHRLAELTDYGKHIATAAACIAVFCADTKYYIEDGASATQNMLVAARALGLGACWVAGDKKSYAVPVAEFLGVSAEQKLVSLVSVGYPAEEPGRPKRPVEEVLIWDEDRSR